MRFRFVPATEDFAPTDEEAREMREAGVEPPSREAREPAPMKAVDVPNEVGGYDPSTAATVTDTPLSALSMNEVFAPKVETKPSPAPRRRNDSHSPKNGAAPKRATEDERPTEINHVSSRAAASATAPTAGGAIAADMEVELTKPQPAVPALERAPGTGKGRPLVLLVAIVVLAGVVAAIGLSLLSGSDDDANDRMLKGLFEEKRYEEAQRLCKSGVKFANPAQSYRMCGQVDVLLLKQQSLLKEPPPEVAEVEPPEGDDAEDADPEADVEDPTPTTARDPTPPPVKVRRVVPRRPKHDQSAVRALFTKGKKALLAGRLSAAKDALVECVEKDETFAECHRLLGVLYAQLDDTQASVLHYRRYVQLRPNAPDASRVHKMIRDVELQASGESSGAPNP